MLMGTASSDITNTKYHSRFMETSKEFPVLRSRAASFRRKGDHIRRRNRLVMRNACQPANVRRASHNAACGPGLEAFGSKSTAGCPDWGGWASAGDATPASIVKIKARAIRRCLIAKRLNK